MEITLILGAVFLLLIMVCWIVFRRSRRSSLRNNAMHAVGIHPDIETSGVGANRLGSSNDVELGPVVTAHPEDWPPEPIDDDLDGRKSEFAEFWGWQDEAKAEHDDEDNLMNGAAYSSESQAQPVEAISADRNPFVDDLEPELATEEENDWSGEAVHDEMAPSEHYDSHELEVEAEFSQNNAYRNEYEPIDLMNSNGAFEDSKVEPRIGIQAHLPLRTTHGDEYANYTAESVIEHIDVDESIRFPQFRKSENQLLDMLGWIPANEVSVSRVQLLSLVRSFGDKLPMPVLLYGRLENSDDWINFEDENVAARFTDLMFVMQLTHRGKSIDEQSWWRFFNMGEHIAKSLSRKFFPSLSMESAVELSQSLTEQVENLNLQAILILASENGRQLSGRTLEYLAREYQLEMHDDGKIFEKPDILPQSPAPLYTLTTELPQSDVDEDSADEVGLALYSNLPCVRDPIDAFDQMVDLARNLENRFPLVLVDESREKVSTKDIEVIRTHILRFVDDLQFCGIEPGGETALRLFGEPVNLSYNTEIPETVHLNPNA